MNCYRESRINFFKYYLYGYLNTRMATRLIEEKTNEDTYERKKKELIAYLKISRWPTSISSIIVAFIKVFELPMSLLIETYRLFYLFLNKIRYLSKIQLDSNDNLYIGIREQRLGVMLKNAKIETNIITVVSLPFDNNDDIFQGFKSIHLLSLCSLKDIWYSYIYSIRMSLIMSHKYGQKDFFFRYYSSFEFFLICIVTTRLHYCRFYYTDNYSRWAFLFGNMTGRTIYLQHGIITDNLYFIKTGCPTEAFFINEKQKEYCCNFLFNSIPTINFMGGLEFCSNEKLLNNGNLDILLVCRSSFFEEEKKISNLLFNIPNINVYIKPHPLDVIDNYVELCEKYGYSLLGRTDFPKVDFVISYNSSLAIEYQDAGVQVLIYKKGEEEMILDKIKKQI